MGSLLCPPLNWVYNNEEAFEAFTVRQARLQTRPRWFHQYQRLMSLVDVMMATCTQATYDAMKWKINPAEFIHVVRVNEGAPAPGEAGDGHLRELLRGKAVSSNDCPVMEEAPETPAPAQLARHQHQDNKVSQAEPLPLQELRKPPDEKPVDPLFSSDSDDVLIMDTEKTEPGRSASPRALSSTQRWPSGADSTGCSTNQTHAKEREGTPRADIEEGTNH